MATKSRTPSLIAFPIATRSAQLVNPNEAFSMLQPANTEPSAARAPRPRYADTAHTPGAGQVRSE
jgi:hypothetical protein